VHTIDLNRLDVWPRDRVLDIGCGEGRHTVAVCRIPGTVCMGGDMSRNTLIPARNKLRFHESIGDIPGSFWLFSAMDITCLPFTDNTFDRVICAEVLEHIPDDDAAIRELVRVLKPGKTLAISVPRFFPEAICWFLSRSYRTDPGGHLRIYRYPELIQKFTDQGLTCLKSHFAHSLHTPYWWLKCLLGLNRNDAWPVRLYHRFLVWDLMTCPALTRYADLWLNPILGKSTVIYFKK
jgi:SAM-dependent methyltransferase